MGKATIRSIAKKLNLAPATVHRALSGSGSVALATRRRIIRCAGESGYVLPERNSRNVAVLVPHFRFFGYMAHMLSSLEKVLHEHNYRIQLIPETDISVLGDHMFEGIDFAPGISDTDNIAQFGIFGAGKYLSCRFRQKRRFAGVELFEVTRLQ